MELQYSMIIIIIVECHTQKQWCRSHDSLEWPPGSSMRHPASRAATTMRWAWTARGRLTKHRRWACGEGDGGGRGGTGCMWWSGCWCWCAWAPWVSARSWTCCTWTRSMPYASCCGCTTSWATIIAPSLWKLWIDHLCRNIDVYASACINNVYRYCYTDRIV